VKPMVSMQRIAETFQRPVWIVTDEADLVVRNVGCEDARRIVCNRSDNHLVAPSNNFRIARLCHLAIALDRANHLGDPLEEFHMESVTQ